MAQQFQRKYSFELRESIIFELSHQIKRFLGWDQGYEEWGVMNEGGSGGGGKKEMTLRNIYDIALTAIAYLSFGLFVLQVIMCITLVIRSYLLVAKQRMIFKYLLFYRRKRMRACQ